jgi:hypothetical protein
MAKKKASKKGPSKGPKKNGNGNGNGRPNLTEAELAAKRAGVAVADSVMLVEKELARLADPTTNVEVLSGPLLNTMAQLERLQKLAESARKKFDEEVKTRFQKKYLQQSPDQFAVTVAVTTKVSPSWKDEACREHEALCKAQGKTFVKATYEGEVRGRYPEKDSYSVKLVEAGSAEAKILKD